MTIRVAADVTREQQRVIELLADGIPVNDIAIHTGRAVADVNAIIWDACLALRARDRNHLVALAYQRQLLAVPGHPSLAAVTEENERLHHALEVAQREAREARRAATDARNDLAVDAEKRQAAERELAEAVAAASVANGMADRLATAERDLAAARKTAATLRRTLERRTTERDEARDRAADGVNAATLRARVDELRTRLDRYEGAGTKPRVVVDPGPAGTAAVQWAVDRLAVLSQQHRDIAARRSAKVADHIAVAKAEALHEAAVAISKAWKRKTADRKDT